MSSRSEQLASAESVKPETIIEDEEGIKTLIDGKEIYLLEEDGGDYRVHGETVLLAGNYDSRHDRYTRNLDYFEKERATESLEEKGLLEPGTRYRINPSVAAEPGFDYVLATGILDRAPGIELEDLFYLDSDEDLEEPSVDWSRDERRNFLEYLAEDAPERVKASHMDVDLSEKKIGSLMNAVSTKHAIRTGDDLKMTETSSVLWDVKSARSEGIIDELLEESRRN